MRLTLPVSLCLCGGIACPIFAGDKMVVPTQTQSGWRISGGPVMRQVSGPEFSLGSNAAAFDLPAVFGPEVPIVAPTAVGDLGTYSYREYDDGFVGTDGGTATTGLTSAWGYDVNSQYSGGMGGVLTMTIAPGSSLAGYARLISSSSTQNQANVDEDDQYEAGVHFEIDRLSEVKPGLKMGPVFGFSLFGSGGDSGNGGVFNGTLVANDYSVGVIDRYQVPPGVLPPSAPYSNTGGVAGPSIPNTPFDRTLDPQLTDTFTADFASNARVDFDYTVFSTEAGWKVEWDHDQFYTNLSSGIVLNIMSWDGSHKEASFQGSTQYASYRDSDDGVDVFFGAYVQGMAGYQLTEVDSVYMSLRYDVSEGFKQDIGPSKVEQDLSGWTLGIGYARQF